MFDTNFYYNYHFYTISHSKYHHTNQRHGSPMNYFAYMIKGTSKIVSENKTIHICEGDVFFIPKNLSYQSYWYGNDEIRFLSFGCFNFFASDCKNLDLQIVRCSKETASMLASVPTTGTNLSLDTIASFYSVAAKLLPTMTGVSLSESRAIFEIAKNKLAVTPECSNNRLADMCNISLPYLYKIFKQHSDDTPNSLRRKIICHKAVELLTTTDLSVEEISNQLSFSSSSYFRKIFKLYTGQTPSKVRKSRPF